MTLLADNLARELALDITKSFIVQAPAGSGKTSLLTQRFLKLLLSVEQPEQVLALTFTKKASNEMRDRVLNMLLQPESTLAHQVLAHAKIYNWQILENPNRIKIQTFDSLCAFIVSKRPFLSGFGASMNVTNFVEQLYQQSVASLLQKVKDLPAYQADFTEVFNHFDNDRNRLAQLLESLISTRQQWLELVLTIKEHASVDKDDLRQHLNYQLSLVRQNFIDNAHAALTAIESGLLTRILEIAHIEGLLAKTCLPFSLEEILLVKDLILTKEGQLRKTITIAQKIYHGAHKQELKKILNILSDSNADFTELHALNNLVPESYTEQQISVMLSLINVLLLLIAEFDLQTFAKSEVDFVQIAIAASNALGHLDAPSELALELDYNLQHILVDEFQDTSQAQFKVLQQLTNSWDDYSSKTIFFVGDPMQSIYKFRQANVSIFLNVKEHGFNNLSVDFLALETNFRASQLLVDWTNMVCRQFFPKVDDYQLGAVSFAPSVAFNDCQEQTSVVQGFFAHDQSAQIVKLIEQHPGESIAILIRARTHLPQIIKALNQANVMYAGVDIGLLVDKPIVQDLLIITKALLDFNSQISWLALLRLPWIGLTLSDLQLIVNQGTTTLGAILAECELSADGLARLAVVRPIILQAYFNKTNLALSSLVRFVFMNLTANLQISKSENFEVTSYLKFLSQLEVEHTALTSEIIDSRLDALYINYGGHNTCLIQVMTIHKAKGLEFDTVIIPYLHKYPQNSQSQLIIFDDRLIAQIKDASEQFEPIYKYLFEKNSRQNALEAKRLFYVALTRAKKNIYLLAEPQYNKKPHKNSFVAFLGSFVNSFITIEDKIEQASFVKLNYKRIPLKLLNSSPLQLTNNALPDELIAVKYFDPNSMRLTGIVLHEILRYVADLGIANITSHEIFTPYIQQSLASKTYQRLALKALEKVFENERALIILSNIHSESYNEWSIMTNVRGEVKKNILDRAYLDHNGIFWIIDYKLCDDHELQSKIIEFNKQLQRYAYCVINLKKYQQVKAVIYLLLQDRFIDVDIQNVGFGPSDYTYLESNFEPWVE